jgi:hypothetical protein
MIIVTFLYVYLLCVLSVINCIFSRNTYLFFDGRLLKDEPWLDLGCDDGLPVERDPS